MNVTIGYKDFIKATSINPFDKDKSTKMNKNLGEIIKATVTKLEKGKATLQTKDNFSFEVDAKELDAEIGDELAFEVVKSDKNNITLKQLRFDNVIKSETMKQFSKDDLMEMFKQNNLATDEDLFKKGDKSVENQKKMMDAIAKIKRELNYSSGNVSKNAIGELLSSGLSLEKISLNILNTVMKEIEEKPAQEISDADLNKIVNSSTNKELSEKKQVVKALVQNDLPISEKNIKSLESVENRFNEIKSLTDESIISHLKSGKPSTLENLYISKFSSTQSEILNGDKEGDFNNLKPQIEKAFERDGIEKNNDNLANAKLLFTGDVPITKENVNQVSFLRNLAVNVSEEGLLHAACENIKKDMTMGEIDLKNMDNYSPEKAKELMQSYNNVIKDIPNIKTENIEILLKRQIPLTLNNLRNETNLMQAKEANNNYSALGEDISVKTVTAKRQLAEIQLKLTSEAAMRLTGKNININNLPLQQAVESLRELEKESYAKNLKIMGAEVSAQNINEMADVFDKIKSFKPLTNNVFGGIMLKKSDFTINGISSLVSSAKLLEGYDTFATAVSSKYGDRFSQVKEQFESLLNGMGIEPTADNIRASSILSRNEIDVNLQNINNVKIIDTKINSIYDRLHPNIAANMIKEGLNPANMHVDDVVAYIDKFNDIYGEGIGDKLANFIMEIDDKKDLDKTTRDSMIAIYRMLNAIKQDNSVALGVSLKNDTDLTLGNLLESSKYYQRTKGKVSDIDTKIDDNSYSITQSSPENSIKSILEKTTENALTTVGDVKAASINTLLNQNNMSITSDNIKMAGDVIDSDAPNKTKALSDYELNMLNITKFAETSSPDRLLEYIQKTPEFSNDTIESAINKLSEIERLNQFNPQDIEKINQVIENIQKSSASVVLWMEQNKIPTTLNNIVSTQNLVNNPFYIGEQINKLANTDDLKDVDLSEEAAISDEISDLSAKQVLNNVNHSLQNIKETIHSRHTLENINLIQNAIKVQNFIENRDDNGYFQIPIKQNGKISSLNMYVLNNEIVNKEDAKVFLSLDTANLGKVNIYLHLDKNNANLQINTQSKQEADILNANMNELKDLLKNIDIELDNISFKVNEPKNILEMEIMPIPNLKEQIMASDFEFTI